MAAEALARKKAVRRAQRAAITRAITQVETLIAAEVLDEAKLKRKKNILEKELVKTHDAEILESVPHDELETEVEESDEVQERIVAALASIGGALKTPPPSERSTPPGGGDPSPSGTPPSRASPLRDREGSRSPTGYEYDRSPVDGTPPTLRRPLL